MWQKIFVPFSFIRRYLAAQRHFRLNKPRRGRAEAPRGRASKQAAEGIVFSFVTKRAQIVPNGIINCRHAVLFRLRRDNGDTEQNTYPANCCWHNTTSDKSYSHILSYHFNSFINHILNV